MLELVLSVLSLHIYITVLYKCIYIYIYIYIYTYTHTYIHTYIHTHIHTYIHTYTYVPIFRYLYFFFFLFCRILSLSPFSKKKLYGEHQGVTFLHEDAGKCHQKYVPERNAKSHSPCSPILVPISQKLTKFCLLVQGVRYMHIPWPPGFPAAPSSAPEALLKLVQDVRRSGTQETHLCH